MKKFLSMLLVVAMVCTLFVPALAADENEGIMLINDESESNPVETTETTETTDPKFPDAEGHWSESSINRWADAGLVQGDNNGNVNPNSDLTRAEFATLMYRLLGLKDDPNVEMPADVTSDAWYAEAMRACKAAGIMTGDQNGNLNPNAPISRAEAMVVFARAMGVRADEEPDFSTFEDGTEVADWCAGYLSAMVEMGIISGIPSGDSANIDASGNINRASVFALLDKAVVTYITEPGEYEINDPNAFVIINVPANEDGTAADVKITGTAASVVVSAGNDADVSAKVQADVVKIDSDSDVTLERGSNVGNVDVNAAANIENKGTVENLNANVSDVTYDGKAPANMNTAEGVDAPTDSKGNTVTDSATSGSTGGSSGGSSSHSYKYNVVINVKDNKGGSVAANVMKTDEAGTTVTLTVTPDAQNGAIMPYVLKSLTVTKPEAPAADNGNTGAETEADKPEEITNNQFIMDVEGTYIVDAEFVQPIEKAELIIVDGADDLKTLQGYGYPAANEENEATVVAENPWLALAVKFGEGYSKGETVNSSLTSNGVAVSAWATQHTTLGRWQTSYVGSAPDADSSGDALSLSDSATEFALSFSFKSASYAFKCDYVAPGVTENMLHTVTFKTSTGATVKTYKGAQDQSVGIPTAPSIDGYYFLNKWTDAEDNQLGMPAANVTIGETDAVYTAQYMQITPQSYSVRPAGAAYYENNEEEAVTEDDFDYAAAYTYYGITLSGTTFTVNAETLVDKMLRMEEDAPDFNFLKQEVGDEKYYFFGISINIPENAASVVMASTVDGLDGSSNTAENFKDYPTTADGKPQLFRYFGMFGGENFWLEDTTWTRYCKWLDEDDNIIAVTTFDLTRKTINSTATVTIDDESQTMKLLDIVDLPDEEEMTKPGYIFNGWYLNSVAPENKVNSEKGDLRVFCDGTYVSSWTPMELTIKLEDTFTVSGWDHKEATDTDTEHYYYKTITYAEAANLDLPHATGTKELDGMDCMFNGWKYKDNGELKTWGVGKEEECLTLQDLFVTDSVGVTWDEENPAQGEITFGSWYYPTSTATASDVKPANLKDHSENEITDLYTTGSYKINATEGDEHTYWLDMNVAGYGEEENYTWVPFTTAVMYVKDLKEHTNGDEKQGNWVGFALKAPEGATGYRAVVNADSEKLSGNLSAISELDEDIYGDETDAKGATMYTTVPGSDAASQSKEYYLVVAWTNENGGIIKVEGIEMIVTADEDHCTLYVASSDEGETATAAAVNKGEGYN